MPLKAIRLRPRKSTCGEQAQKRLIEAGLELFSRYSFDGVSTRFLADKANVNQASIQYYFGSKEGLYHAVTRHIVEQFMKRLQPVISKIEHQLDIDRPPREKCFHLLCELLDRAIITVLGSPDTKKWIGVAIREQIEPTDAFEILYEGVMKPFHSCLCSLVAVILGSRPDGLDTQLRVYAMRGQILMFHFASTEVFRSLGWEEYGPEQVAAVRTTILDHVRAILGMPQASLSRKSWLKTAR